jgi:AraC-like DNA-binding protein
LDSQPLDLLKQTTLNYSQLNQFGMALLSTASFNTYLPFIEEMTFEPLSEILTVVATGKNLKTAMESLMEVGPYSLLNMHLQYESGEAFDYLICDVSEMPQDNQRFMVESAFGMCKRFLPKQLTYDDIICEVHFVDDFSDVIDEYESHFKVPVLFNQIENRLILKKGTSLFPLPSHNPVLHEQAKKMLLEKTQLLIKLQGLAYELHQVLKKQNQLDRLNLEDCAKLLHMSVRSLQRRLKQEGTSFSQVKYQFLVEQSCDLLKQTNLSLDEIASQLGFADRASFSRVFKKYKGQWPARYRDNNKLG